MLKFGLPVGACKVKMQAEGVDPSVLDMDPDGPSPNAAAAPSGAHLGGAFAMPALKKAAPAARSGGGGGGGGAPSLLDQLKGSGGMSLKKVGT